MDWVKAKTILIIAFIFTNLFLAGNIYYTKIAPQKNYFESKEAKESLISLLEKKDIKLTRELDVDTPKMKSIIVVYQTPDKNILKQLKKGKLDIIGGKKLIFQGDFSKKMSINSAKKEAEKFLYEYGFSEEKLLKYARKRGDYIEVAYTGAHNGHFLEESYVKFKISSDGKFVMERLWLDEIREMEKGMAVMNSLEALTKSYEILPTNISIEKMELGYYFKLSKHFSAGNTKSATAFPFWRIKTTDGEYYYIDALDF